MADAAALLNGSAQQLDVSTRTVKRDIAALHRAYANRWPAEPAAHASVWADGDGLQLKQFCAQVK